MKTIGLIGGLSWHSTVDYYRYLNEQIQQRMGGYNSAKILLCSFNFEEIRTAKTPAERAAHFMRAARNLESSGADLILICANTGHVQADSIRANVKIPLLHIVDAIAAEIKKRGLRKVGLL